MYLIVDKISFFCFSYLLKLHDETIPKKVYIHKNNTEMEKKKNESD